MAKKKYYYTSDAGGTFLVETSDYLGDAAALQEIPKGAPKPRHGTSGFNDLRHVWAKEAVPSSPGSTKRVKLIVQADSPLYKTSVSYPVCVKDVLYITTGRVGESLTFSADSAELIAELDKEQKAQTQNPLRSIKKYYYTGDDGKIYLHDTAEYLAVAAGLPGVPQEPTAHQGFGDVSTSLNYPRYIWVKEASPRFSGKTQRIKIVVEADSHLYRTDDRYPVYLDNILYRSTGRVGESMTFSADSAEAKAELAKLSSSS